jgi:type IV secretory pathway TraG/TraD family ATPase VirD4
MFIGSNDMNTCKEYSELCGNITVVTSSTSGSVSSNDINLSNQTQVRPLIYPSDLQRLNKPGNIGNSIIVTFGNYPLKTYFSPSFKVPFYQMGKMDTTDLSERYFDENTILYNVANRNEIIFGESPQMQEEKAEEEKKETITFTPGPGVTAIIHGQDEEENSDIADQDAADSEEQMLIALWRMYKETNPEGTLEDFYKDIASTNSEEQ